MHALRHQTALAAWLSGLQQLLVLQWRQLPRWRAHEYCTATCARSANFAERVSAHCIASRQQHFRACVRFVIVKERTQTTSRQPYTPLRAGSSVMHPASAHVIT